MLTPTTYSQLYDLPRPPLELPEFMDELEFREVRQIIEINFDEYWLAKKYPVTAHDNVEYPLNSLALFGHTNMVLIKGTMLIRLTWQDAKIRFMQHNLSQQKVYELMHQPGGVHASVYSEKASFLFRAPVYFWKLFYRAPPKGGTVTFLLEGEKIITHEVEGTNEWTKLEMPPSATTAVDEIQFSQGLHIDVVTFYLTIEVPD